MTAAAWIPIILNALELAVEHAKKLGLPDPDDSTRQKILGAVEAKLAEVLPATIVGVALGAIAVANKAVAAIDSLPEVDRCPECGGVLTMHVGKPIGGGEVTRSFSCDACGWLSL